MKKLLNDGDQKEVQERIIDLLVEKKCTLADFERVSEKVHQFYKDNAVVNVTTSIRKNTENLSHYHQQSSTTGQDHPQ